jgi:hypothetical protein
MIVWNLPDAVRWGRSLWAGSLSALVLLTGGCGQGSRSTGIVTGTVRYQGKPVTAGFVNFLDSSRGMAGQAQMDDKGAFTLEGDLEVGTYKVYLQPPLPQQLPPGTVAEPAEYDIPRRYQDPVQTPVTQEVKAGSNTIVIEFPDLDAPPD